MADRYWVGGSGTWDATSTANWSETSGGIGGASAPTSLDDVYFDSGSDTGANFTVTVGTGAVCKTLNANTASPLDFTMTLAGSAALSIYGSLYFPVTRLTRTYSGEIRFLSGASDNVISTNGVSLPWILISNSTGKWTLGGNLTCTGINFTNGWIDTSSSSYNLSSSQFISENYSAGSYRRLTLNSSIFSAQGFSPNIIDGVNFIFEPGTSTVRFSGGGVLKILAIPNWYNLELIPVHYGIELSMPSLTTAHSITFHGVSDTRAVFWTGIRNINTNYLTFKDSGAGHRHVLLSGNITVNELFKTESTNGSNRWSIESSVTGVNRTITAKAVELTDVDFKNITAAGESGTWSGTRIGNAGGNVNINFTPPKTVYWNRPTGGAWNSLAWATTSGGTPSLELVPLPQDTAIIENTGLNSGATISIYSWNTPNINATSRTLPFTFSIANTQGFGSNRYNPEFCGDLLLNNNCTLADTGSIYLRGLSTQNVSLPSSFLNAIVVDKLNSAVNFSNSFTTTGSFTLTSGIVNFLSNASVLTFTSSNTNARTLNIGANNLTISGTSWNTIDSTNLTLLGTGKLVFTSASEKTFNGGNADYGNIILRHAGMGNLSIGGFNTLGGIDNDIASTAGSSIIFGGNGITRIRGKVRLSGTSSSPLVLASPSGTTFTLTNLNTASIQQLDYVTISNSIATPANNWFAGTRSTVTNSTGWSNTFSSAADLFWVGGSGTWDSTTNTNWAVVPSGTGGTIAPASTNDVYFDSGSDTGSAFTVTLGTGAVNKNFTVSSLDQTMTIAGSATWSCHGNIDIQSGASVVNSHSGSMNLNGTAGVTNTIFTSGVPLVPNYEITKRFNINGGKWLMTSALTLNTDNGGLWLNSGIFDTQGYSLTLSSIYTTGSGAKELYFRNSTIVTKRDGFVNNSTNGSLLFDAGTSTIDIGALISGTSTDTLTFFNVNTIGYDGKTTIGPQLTIFNNLQCFTNYYTKPLQLTADIIVNGALSIVGKLNLISGTQGTRRTVTATSVTFPNNVPINFRDINLSGTASPISGPNLGDAGNNQGINFPAPKTIYLVSSQVISASSLRWSLTSGGAATEYLLPQDIGIIDNSSPASINWPISEAYIAGTLDFTNRTNPITFTLAPSATVPSVFYIAFNGDLKLSNAVTLVTPTGTGLNSDLQFTGHKNQSLITAGQQLNSINVNKFNSSLSLGSNLSIASNRTLTVTAGTLNTNNYNISAGSVSSSNSNVRSINLGTSSITLTNTGTVWDTATPTNLSLSATDSSIILKNAGDQTFAGGGLSYGRLSVENP